MAKESFQLPILNNEHRTVSLILIYLTEFVFRFKLDEWLSLLFLKICLLLFILLPRLKYFYCFPPNKWQWTNSSFLVICIHFICASSIKIYVNAGKKQQKQKLSCPLVYNLVVEIRNIQTTTTKTKNQTLRLFGACILSDVCLQSMEEAKALVAGYRSQLKTSGRREPLKGSPYWSREVSAFHETRLEGRWCEKGINLGTLMIVKTAFLEWRVWRVGLNL